MFKPEDLKAALESIEEDNEIDLEEENTENEENESNDAIDESVPKKEEEKEDESEDEPKDENAEPEDTSDEEGGDPTGDDPAEEGGEEPAEGGSEEPEPESEPTEEDAKKELLDETPMPDTDPAEQSVEIKDADDSDANASPKDVALDMEEVGSLEKMLDTLNNEIAPASVISRVSALFSNIIRMSHGLESFGLDKEFKVTTQEDVETLKVALANAIEKHKQ